MEAVGLVDEVNKVLTGKGESVVLTVLIPVNSSVELGADVICSVVTIGTVVGAVVVFTVETGFTPSGLTVGGSVGGDREATALMCETGAGMDEVLSGRTTFSGTVVGTLTVVVWVYTADVAVVNLTVVVAAVERAMPEVVRIGVEAVVRGPGVGEGV